MPTVTVLMPAYNAGKFIGESIRSVLAQSYSHWELLIVNDGSSDNTVDVVKSFNDPRIRLVENPQNMGLIKTLNRGLAEAQGEWIARLDADDLASPDRIALQMAYLEQNPECIMVGGRSNIIDEHGLLKKSGELEFLVREPPQALRWAHLFYNPFRHSAVTFRREVVEELGGYPEDAKDLEDFALWSRMVAQFQTGNLDDIVCDYRVHSNSVLAQARKARVEVSDPRRATAAPYFIENGLGVGLSELDAIEWARLWCSVRFQTQNGSLQYRRMLKLLKKLVQLAPTERGIREVFCSAYAMLAKRAKNRKQHIEYLNVNCAALLACGGAYWRFMLEQYQRSRGSRK